MAKEKKVLEEKDEVVVKEDIRPEYNPSDVSIKEMMAMKSCTYDEALHLLRNPTPHVDMEEERRKLVANSK